MSFPINLDFDFKKYDKRLIKKEIKILDKLEPDLIIVWCYPIDCITDLNELHIRIFNYFTKKTEVTVKYFTDNLQEIY